MTATCVVTHPSVGSYAKLFIDLYAFDMTFDPTGSTVNLVIDGTSYVMTWIGAPVLAGGYWSQYARTSVLFVGSAVTPVGTDVQLATGRHYGYVYVTLPDGQVVPIPASPVDIR